ncbi:MAG: hypothetical protein Q7T82_14530 [Armatimonadota bacterium]|nr:hypothetical protein [Armatimonadota bacterium]
MRIPSVLAALVAVLLMPSAAAFAGQPGDFNAARFGTAPILMQDRPSEYAPALTDGDNRTSSHVSTRIDSANNRIPTPVQIEWRQPRDIYLVRLVFEGQAPNPDEVEIQWWRRIWPDNGEGGWLKLDDPFNGGFITAAAEATRPNDNTLEFRFKPLEKTEAPGITKTGFDYRSTYKIRALVKVPARIAEIECYTDSNWKRAGFDISFYDGKFEGRFEGRNAFVEQASISPGKAARAQITIRYADNPNRLSPDRGYIIVRQNGKGQDFSFFAADVLSEKTIFIRDLNVRVTHDLVNVHIEPKWRPAGSWDATIVEKVAASPEQTFERAMKEIPRKWIDVAHMGLPVLRQEVSIDAQACIFIYSKSLRGPGKEVDVSPQFPEEWSMRRLTQVTNSVSFGPPSPKRITRRLEDGYLPVIHSKWEQDGISYHQTIFAAALDPEVTRKSLALPRPAPRPIGKGIHAANFGSDLRGDEPICALSRMEIINPGKTEQTAYIWLKPNPMSPMSISPEGLLVLDKPTKPSVGKDHTPIGGQVDIRGKGQLAYLKDFVPEGGDPKDARDVIRYTVKLAPGEKHAIVIKVPYIEQMTAAEVAQFKALDWESSHEQIARLWKNRLAKAVESYKVPQPELMNLYRTNLWHVLIGTDRDVPTGLYQHGAGTYAYPMYANETMMVQRSLEMRGEVEEARRLVEPYLMSQGVRSLPGNFKSKDGLLYAAAPQGYDHYTAQGYNMHHGFILWAAAEHYLWTRDRSYLKAIAPKLIAACDWITRERKATMVLNPDDTRPLEYGLAPAGDLEDVDEFLYFYTTNAYYYLGMNATAEALAQAGYWEDAARIAAAANAYAQDIMTSVREAVATSPVVKLLDGSYVPYVPHRAYAPTDRGEGWIREALYCALHLESCGLIKPNDPLVTWILQDLEDRIFLSEESGPGRGRITNMEDQYFSLGGFNPQPNLLDNGLTYLRRNQIANWTRAFFNIYSASIYPDTVCFSECVPPFADGGGPLYKTPDESKFIQFMRQMLILEMGDTLCIGRGVPRAWMTDGKSVEMKDAPTHFGPMGMKITSAVSKGRIIADLNLPKRNPPRSVLLSLRHPEGKKIKTVTVNGKSTKTFDPTTGVIRLNGTANKVRVAAYY